ncbi:MAG: hypothetical protein G01um10143_266 [Parcubacteria group bacterium Gr01-1014_3]|nr:MAG: hypothetical protein G01um10143_266 [Parcubacteria group bacterium Gr01-1014_3]
MYTTKKAEQTKKLAAKLAKEILSPPAGGGPHQKHARIIGLVGDLGAGKTTFTQGFAKALGIKRRMVSPTFLIFRTYPIPKLTTSNLKLTTFYHVDAYRIKKTAELKTLHFDKVLKNPKNIVVIEWADQIKKILPKDTIWIRFEHGSQEKERKIHF